MTTRESRRRTARNRLEPIAITVLVALFVLTGIAPAEDAAGATPPSGFSDALVANIAFPTALAFTPDVRLLVATQQGSLRVVEGGRCCRRQR